MNISQIAKLAGVSPAAVSRYLNNGYLSEEKKAAIAKVIKETGYIPSSQAQTLRTKRSKLVGLIIPKIDSDSISQVVAGIEEILAGYGYQLLLANSNNNPHKEIDYLNTFKQNIVDGIILFGTISSPEHKKLIRSLDIPIVVLGQQSEIASSISHDDYSAAYGLTKHVISKGHKNIGYIGVTEKDIAVGVNRKKGFLDAMADNGLTAKDSAMESGSFTMENGYKNTRRLLETNPRLDAIICATDTIALGAIKYLNENNIAIPSQIAVAGFGDSKASSILNPSLSTVHFYYRECGTEGAKLLLDKINNPDSPNKSIKLGFEIIENQSV